MAKVSRSLMLCCNVDIMLRRRAPTTCRIFHPQEKTSTSQQPAKQIGITITQSYQCSGVVN